MTGYVFLPCVGAQVRSTVVCATSVWWILIITASGWTTASVQRTTGQLSPSIFITIMWIITNFYLCANPFFSHRWFIATISSALLGAVMLLVYNAALFILYFAGRDNLRYDCNFPSNSSACNETLRIFGTAMPDAVFPVLTAILGVLALIAVVLVGHLTVFHFYLSKHRCFQHQVHINEGMPSRNTFIHTVSKGLSTYDYIVLHRESEEDTRNGGGLERGFHGRCAFLRRKVAIAGP